ncbi:hypothetical protein K474DRAFT_1647144 [Panus rudis PR-1116 ss-1]|nr:hypothetical protein K474DRAFT_1647144 [Panus rudis PR-1116 ss-1]
MWVIAGSFDGEQNVVTFQKSKLLMPGKQYMLGRKNRPLVLNHKSVSHDHMSFNVGDYTEEDVGNPDKRPTLELHNAGSKSRRIERNGKSINVNPKASLELEDGDQIFVLNDVPVSVKWENVCCYTTTPEEFSISACAKIGVSMVVTPQLSVTHHLVSTYSLTPAIASSLLTLAHLVKPDWLTTLLSMGFSSSTDDPCQLEMTFSLPRVAEFRPEYSPSIPSTLRTLKVWEPNEARLNMFSRYRFVFVGERGREVSIDMRELIKRGSGEYECFAVESGRKSFHGVLAKGKGKGKELVLVADEHAMGTAVGKDQWMEYVQEAAEYHLQFIRPEKITQAVAHVDISYINSALTESVNNPHRFSTPLPDVVPNTHVEEPSIPPSTSNAPAPDVPPEPAPPVPKLVRRTTRKTTAPIDDDEPIVVDKPADSNDAEAGPSKENESKEESPDIPIRKPLRRRTTASKPVEDKSMDDDSVILEPPPKPPSRTQTRLRRRDPKSKPAGFTFVDPFEEEEKAAKAKPKDPTQSVLEKYKSLYEESDPDRIAKTNMEDYKNMFTQRKEISDSLTQPESSTAATNRPSGLDVVPEEEEESTLPRSNSTYPSETPMGTLKRKTRIDDENGDVDMEDVDKPKKSKRRAVEGGDSVQTQAQEKPNSKQQTKSKKPQAKIIDNKASESTGAAPGKPDKDEAFLKAVASTKRGKKHEDSFDREFNQLRISKPDLQREQAVEEWKMLEEFGDDGDVRGNFMVIVEMDVPRQGGVGVYRRGEGRMEWENRPDFKKFKKKHVGERRKPVDLVLEDPEGFEYPSQPIRKTSHSKASQSFEATQAGSLPKAQTQASPRKTQTAIVDSDDEEMAAPTGTRRSQRRTPQPQSKPTSQASTKSSRATKTKQSQSKKKPLFIVSEEEDEDMQDNGAGKGDAMSGDEDVSSGKSRSQAETLQSAPPTMEKFSGRATRSTATKRKAPAALLDDDSDDGVTFKGFGNKRRKK